MNIKPYCRGLAALIAVSAMPATYAAAPQYDFAEGFYQIFTQPSGSLYSSDRAVGVDGSLPLTANLIGTAEFDHESADFNGVPYRATSSGNYYEFGLGYRVPLSDAVDLVPTLAYAHDSGTASGGLQSLLNPGSGYDAGVLLRAMVAPHFELDGSFYHSTASTSSNSAGITAFYDFGSHFAIGFGYESKTAGGTDTGAWTARLRYYFD